MSARSEPSLATACARSPWFGGYGYWRSIFLLGLGFGRRRGKPSEDVAQMETVEHELDDAITRVLRIDDVAHVGVADREELGDHVEALALGDFDGFDELQEAAM